MTKWRKYHTTFFLGAILLLGAFIPTQAHAQDGEVPGHVLVGQSAAAGAGCLAGGLGAGTAMYLGSNDVGPLVLVGSLVGCAGGAGLGATWAGEAFGGSEQWGAATLGATLGGFLGSIFFGVLAAQGSSSSTSSRITIPSSTILFGSGILIGTAIGGTAGYHLANDKSSSWSLVPTLNDKEAHVRLSFTF